MELLLLRFTGRIEENNRMQQSHTIRDVPVSNRHLCASPLGAKDLSQQRSDRNLVMPMGHSDVQSLIGLRSELTPPSFGHL
jgi:hypothetical protein